MLGINWNTFTDQIVINLEDISVLAREREPTKKNIVSLVGKFYDPLGFLAPIVVQFKMFLQLMCESKIEWDQLITEDLLSKWQKLLKCLWESQTISIPRCCTLQVTGGVTSYTLCGFCEASLGAYAAVVYLLMETNDGNTVRFLAAKTRVSSLREQTIPRLELLSSLLSARLITTISQSLVQLSYPCCFTDSMVTLYWIEGVYNA